MNTLTHDKTRKGATKASNADILATKTTAVSNIIKRIVESELVPTNEKYVLLDKYKRPQCYRAEFSFRGNLRYYLSLQSYVSGEKKKLSNLISFISADIGPDALAVPVSTYVSDTWGCDGTKILQMVDASLGSTGIRTVSGTLTNGCKISITVNDNDLHLTIMGGLKMCARSSIVKVIEQICWLLSVADDTPTRRLATYINETKQGTSPSEYSETIYTGDPVIVAGGGIRLNVSFTKAEVLRQANQDLVSKSGHCWKTMAGVTIIANGFAIPSRPRQGSGLEASLPVLRQLIRRGYHGGSPLALDRPMVVFPAREVAGTDKSGQDSTIYKVRYILAADFQQPLRRRGNVVYWHFDAGKACNSERSLEQLEQGIRVGPAAIDPDSRHFVGWTSSAGHQAAAPRDIPLGVHSDCIPCPHYKLVIPTLSGTLRLPGLLSLNATLGTEKLDTKLDAKEMLKTLEQKLHHVTARLFVLWDKFLERGWLVGGDTVALHLIRVYAKKNEGSKLSKFDFMSLKNLGTSASSAYKVLSEMNVLAVTEKEGEEVLGPYLGELYAMLLFLTEKTPELTKTSALSTKIQGWYDKKFSTTIAGADFDELTGSNAQPGIYTYKMSKDPGWLKWAKEEKVTFLFGSGLGEIMEPEPGCSCPCFPTLPTGENLLASELRILNRLIMKHAGDQSCFPPDKTVARLSRGHGWERGLDPFPRQKCQADHLGTPGPNCLPVQRTLPARVVQHTNERLKKDVELLRGKSLYTVKDFNDMLDKNPSGVVVFGRQPGPKELRDSSWRSQQRSKSEQQQPVTATAVQPSNRPASRGSASGSTTSRTLPTPGAERAETQSPSSASGPRTPSTASIRSNGSSSHPGPSQGNSTGAGQLQTSATRSPASSVRKAASKLSLRSIVSNTHPKAPQGNSTDSGQPQASRSQETSSQSPATSVHKAASSASLRSTVSNAPSRASQRSRTGAGQPQASASQAHADPMHKTASNASLRSTSSTTRSVAASNGAGRSHETGVAVTIQTATRKPSNASIRTTSSVASRATTGSQAQRPSAQESDAALKKTSTNSSDRTTGSHSSRVAQNLGAFNSNRERQQLVPGQPISSNQGTSSRMATENTESTSAGPAPTEAGGPNVTS